MTSLEVLVGIGSHLIKSAVTVKKASHSEHLPKQKTRPKSGRVF